MTMSIRAATIWRLGLGAALPILLSTGCQWIESVPSASFPEFDDRIETWTDKTILVVTPHPDDEAFGAAGTLAMLAARGNKIHVVVCTNDDKGSRDPDMTSERLTMIRRQEEERASEIVGIPTENLVWLGHEDGMLEYVDARDLTKQIAREIRRVRPDALFSIDPGEDFRRWHKSDHNAGAFITVDAVRAARWRLYFPELEQDEGLKAYSVPICYMFYSTQPNYKVDIHDYIEQRLAAMAAHESQWDPYVDKYAPMTEEVRTQLIAQLREGRLAPRENGRFVEYFRRAEY